MKPLQRLVFLTALVSVSTLSMAAGTITFKGKVIAQTCSIQVEGVPSPVITLPQVATNQLDIAGKVAGLTPFKIEATGCDTTGAKITPRILGAQVSALGNLVNTAPAPKAGNVELQLLDALFGTPILLAQSGITALPDVVVPAGQTQGEHQFAVQYYAAAPATAGDVQSVVNYDVIYD